MGNQAEEFPVLLMSKARPPGPEDRAPVTQASTGLEGRCHLHTPQEKADPGHCSPALFDAVPLVPRCFPGKQAPCCPLLPELGIVLEPQRPCAEQFLRSVSSGPEWSKERHSALYPARSASQDTCDFACEAPCILLFCFI